MCSSSCKAPSYMTRLRTKDSCCRLFKALFIKRRECIQSICMLLAAAACCLLERSEAGPPPPVPSPPLREAPGIADMR
ncbi:unnamed protein product [Bathycoccus prasinos]